MRGARSTDARVELRLLLPALQALLAIQLIALGTPAFRDRLDALALALHVAALASTAAAIAAGAAALQGGARVAARLARWMMLTVAHALGLEAFIVARLLLGGTALPLALAAAIGLLLALAARRQPAAT